MKILESTNYASPDENRTEANDFHVEYRSQTPTSGIMLFSLFRQQLRCARHFISCSVRAFVWQACMVRSSTLLHVS